MNASFCSLPARWLLFILLSLGCLSHSAPPLSAADSAVTVQATAPAVTLEANYLKDSVGNRSRMIQLSLVFVVFSCALLWWRRT